jgi:hypothetical protein
MRPPASVLLLSHLCYAALEPEKHHTCRSTQEKNLFQKGLDLHVQEQMAFICFCYDHKVTGHQDHDQHQQYLKIDFSHWGLAKSLHAGKRYLSL